MPGQTWGKGENHPQQHILQSATASPASQVLGHSCVNLPSNKARERSLSAAPYPGSPVKAHPAQSPNSRMYRPSHPRFSKQPSEKAAHPSHFIQALLPPIWTPKTLQLPQWGASGGCAKAQISPQVKDKTQCSQELR